MGEGQKSELIISQKTQSERPVQGSQYHVPSQLSNIILVYSATPRKRVQSHTKQLP